MKMKRIIKTIKMKRSEKGERWCLKKVKGSERLERLDIVFFGPDKLLKNGNRLQWKNDY